MCVFRFVYEMTPPSEHTFIKMDKTSARLHSNFITAIHRGLYTPKSAPESEDASAKASSAFGKLVMEPHGDPADVAGMADAQKHATIDALISAFRTRFPREFATIETRISESTSGSETDANTRGNQAISALSGRDGGDRVKSLPEFATVRAWIALSYGTSRSLYG